MTLKEQEREILRLDYELEKEKVEKEVREVLAGLKEKASDGVWLDGIEICEILYDHILLCDKGMAVFCKYEMELTDPLLWGGMKKAYDIFVEYIEDIDEENISFYAVLNSPITQKAYYGLFNPQSEFVVPIKNLEESCLAELEQRESVYSEEVILSFLSCIEESLDGKGSNREDIYSDETGDYIKIRGSLKRRSEVDSERYFWLTLFGGLFGIHKFYSRCYGSFLAYLFTLGFVGVGWMVDLAEICMGISKDRRKAYIGPFEDIKSKRLICLAVGIVYVAVLIGIFLVM